MEQNVLTAITSPFKNPIFPHLLPKDRKCSYCKEAIRFKFEYLNAVMIELRDLESFNDLDKMKVIFFDDHTNNITVGENVKIIGNIEVVESRKTNGDSVSMLFADKVDYESEQEMKIENHDIDEILQFKSESDESGIIPRLIELTATSVFYIKY